MKVAFTICSNNYLAQAKTLGDGLLRHNPDYTVFICLCDKKDSRIDYTSFSAFKILEVSELGIANFEEMCSQYTIIELNTSIKAFAFDYFYRVFPQADTVIYFDPDIAVFAPLTAIEKELRSHAALLTPHILTPIRPDGLTPTENIFTQFGTFNLGFLATARHSSTFDMLGWWKTHLADNCFIKPEKGVFVDQLPMNLAPIFFDGFKISKNPGLNMAPWNLHERRLSERDSAYYVNGETPLIFYHFSKFKPESGDITITHSFSRPHQGNMETFTAMCKKYETCVLENNYKELTLLPCAYGKKNAPRAKKRLWERLARSVQKRLGGATFK